jgi:hypothetical protein
VRPEAAHRAEDRRDVDDRAAARAVDRRARVKEPPMPIEFAVDEPVSWLAERVREVKTTWLISVSLAA